MLGNLLLGRVDVDLQCPAQQPISDQLILRQELLGEVGLIVVHGEVEMQLLSYS